MFNRDGNFLGHIAAISFVNSTCSQYNFDNFIAMNVYKLKTSVLSSSAKSGHPIECTGSVPRPVTRLGCLAGDWRLQSADDGIMMGGDTADTKR